VFFFFQAEDGKRDLVRSRGLGDVYKRQIYYLNADLAARFKAAYGVSGLSKHLWGMQLGELANYQALCKQGLISGLCFLGASTFSIMKFIRRIIIHCVWQWNNKLKAL